MNFLSHFYFVQTNPNPYYTLGTILPDLFRNHRNDWKFNLENKDFLFSENEDLTALFTGWKLHIQVDALFHNSSYFKSQSSLLRNELVKVFTHLPKRPFFLAHVAYELILDSLLIRNNLVDTNQFYQDLNRANSIVLEEFMTKIGINETENFRAFLKNFTQIRYLESYAETKNLVQALDGIGRRVWVEKFSESEVINTLAILDKTLENLNPIFLDVFYLLEKEIRK